MYYKTILMYNVYIFWHYNQLLFFKFVLCGDYIICMILLFGYD